MKDAIFSHSIQHGNLKISSSYRLSFFFCCIGNQLQVLWKVLPHFGLEMQAESMSIKEKEEWKKRGLGLASTFTMPMLATDYGTTEVGGSRSA